MRSIAFCLFFISISCKDIQRPGEKKVAGIKAILSPIAETYPLTKANIIVFAKSNNHGDEVEQLRTSFIAIVCDSIIPYWIGTGWDFNGVTETPRKGAIACGYFITTVLRDAGVRLNKHALAQCASEQMIQKLVNKKYIHRYSNKSQADFIAGLRQTGKGLYLVGLDNHTGFIYYADDGIWFIHSSYLNPGCVVKQDAISNSILYHSKYRVTGKLTDDVAFLRSWYRNLVPRK